MTRHSLVTSLSLTHHILAATFSQPVMDPCDLLAMGTKNAHVHFIARGHPAPLSPPQTELGQCTTAQGQHWLGLYR